MKKLLALLIVAGLGGMCGIFAADKSPLVLDASNRPTPILAGDTIRLPVAGPFYTTLAPLAGANSTITFPATCTLAGLGLAQTFSGADVFTGGVTINTAGLTITDVNVALGTTTGTKFGTSTSQKLAFYNSTPIVQPSGDVATALQNLGLITSATVAATTGVDGTFRIVGSGDATKKFAVEVDSQTTGKTLTLDTGAQTLDRTVTMPVLAGAANFVVREAALTDNAAVRADGTTGLIQDSAVIIDDSGNASGVGTLGISGTLTQLITSASGSGGGGTYIHRCNDGAAMGSGDRLGSIQFSGARDGAATFSTGAVISCFTSEAWNGTSAGSEIRFETTANTTLVRSTALTIGNDASATFTGNIAQSGAKTISTGTGAITLNGNVTIVSGKTLTLSDTTASTSTTTGSLVNAGGFGNAGAAFFGSDVSITAGAANVRFLIQNAASGNPRYIEIKDGTGTKYNWLVGAQYNFDNAFEITPSSAAGGTTYSTPALRISASTGVVTIPNLTIGTNLLLGNAYVAGVVAPTGTIIIYDSTGTAYRVACAL